PQPARGDRSRLDARPLSGDVLLRPARALRHRAASPARRTAASRDPPVVAVTTPPLRASLVTAVAAVGLAFAWQCLAVRYDYRGDWTGLFCIGDGSRLPPELARTNPYRFPHSPGYDGQFYFYIARAPSPRGEAVGYVDNPPLRWRRILVPFAAHLLAL